MSVDEGVIYSADATDNLVRQIFGRAKFIQWLEIELVGFGPGWCEARMVVTDKMHQQHGIVHAGVLMTLSDHCCGGAAATTVPAGKDVITVEDKVTFLRPAVGSELLCRGTVLRTGKNLIFSEAETTIPGNGAADRILVAKMSSTLAVIPRRTPTV
jgi:uncharacterized protein (TIGR00369 family)